MEVLPPQTPKANANLGPDHQATGSFYKYFILFFLILVIYIYAYLGLL